MHGARQPGAAGVVGAGTEGGRDGGGVPEDDRASSGGGRQQGPDVHVRRDERARWQANGNRESDFVRHSG